LVDRHRSFSLRREERYRSLNHVPRVIGGALWGRIGGFISGVVNAAVDWFTGKDIGDHIYAALFGNGGASDSQTVVAQPAKPEKLPAEKAALKEGPPEDSFADEARYSDLLGRYYKDDPVSPTSHVAQSQTLVTPAQISAVISTGETRQPSSRGPIPRFVSSRNLN
jgi:hypothetical protein